MTVSQENQIMGQNPEIAAIEQSTEYALPALEVRELGPWLLRASGGVFQRVNSVFTTRSGEIENFTARQWLSLIEQAVAFYRQRKLRPLFHLTPASVPSELDAMLIERGYQVDIPSEVWSADVGHVAVANSGVNLGDLQIHTTNQPDDAWLSCAFGEDNQKRRIREAIFRNIAADRCFISFRDNERAVACGLGVVAMNRGWIFSMHTADSHRRRGLARDILRRLAFRALERGAERMHLQVMSDNAVALNLYARAGFAKTYDYHYRFLDS